VSACRAYNEGRMKSTALLRQYVEAPEILMIPGVSDALGARLVEKAGFQAVFLSGYAASASLWGRRTWACSA